jgi:hypothetical protein
MEVTRPPPWDNKRCHWNTAEAFHNVTTGPEIVMLCILQENGSMQVVTNTNRIAQSGEQWHITSPPSA